ncbi:NAD-dependent epimerase/dehydratase family protein [Candidatus Bathyarchaeota archaeon]|nr:MAG: NAD-dependent epimerase/dehydratase family protein [Candidatus Bathyarchaeota archaeon]
MTNVLVTGSGGFIGSHLVEILVNKGYNVKAFLRYNSRNHWGWLEKSPVLNEVEIISGDIRDYDSVFNALDDCEQVFHLAALIGIPYSYVSPLAYIQTNVIGTYNVLQASKEKELEKIIVTSTSETYGSAKYIPIDEKHPLIGQSPYSATKISADQLALSYHRSFGLPVKIVRPFNTYGPRQSARAIIPTIITQLLSGNNVLHLGNVFPTRDLTFVEDTANAMISIAESSELYGDVTNIGMNLEISIEDLAKLIAEIMSREISIKTDEDRTRPQNSEVDRLKCDNNKILQKTNWRPKYNLRSGLEKTISWLSDNSSQYKSDLYNV